MPYTPCPSVLIAEDDHNLQALFGKAMSKAGFEVHTVSNGSEVIDTLYDVLPNVLILDIGLPGVSGLEIMKSIRRHESMMRRGGHTPHHISVIVVTGDVNIRQKAESHLADMVLLKPVSIRELIPIAERLRQHTLPRTNLLNPVAALA